MINFNLTEAGEEEGELILMLIYELTNEYEAIRCEALNCLNNLKKRGQWSNFIKKMLKNSEEIKLDSNYLTNGHQLNKYLNSELIDFISNFMSTSKKSEIVTKCLNLLKNISVEYKYPQLFNFIINYLNEKEEEESTRLIYRNII